MDLIFTNKNHEDMGVLQDFDLDLAFGADENDFECSVPAASHCCEAGSLLYMEGTEYGGIVDTIESDTEAKEVKYKGRTWHGILGSKVIEPLKEGEAPGLVPVGRLPFGYTELAYIESIGNQYIDTKYKAVSEDYCIKCKFTVINDEASAVLFGGGASTDIISVLLTTETQLKFYVGSGSVKDALSEFVVGTEYEMECHANNGTFTVKLNGVSRSGSYSGTINKDYPLFIFANNASGSASQFSSIRISGFQIYDNGTLVRDFVPCKNSGGVFGLLDLANNVFYQNAGSGTFASGAVVEQPEQGMVPGTILGASIKDESADGTSLVDRYLVISGDANDCINFILHRIGLSSLLCAFEEAAGVNIQEYQFHRFTDAYSGLTGMLASAGQKLHTEVHGGQVVLSAEAIVDYTADEEFDSDLVDFVAIKKFNAVNHLICLGAGELENRTVIHLYADKEGNISQEQTQDGLDEVVAVYEDTSAEAEELIQKGTEELLKLWEPDKLNVDFDDSTDSYDVGDIVGAYDNITGISVAAVITKKIVTIKNGLITISYKVGE